MDGLRYFGTSTNQYLSYIFYRGIEPYGTKYRTKKGKIAVYNGKGSRKGATNVIHT